MNSATTKPSIPCRDAGYEAYPIGRACRRISLGQRSRAWCIDSRGRVYLFNRGEHPVAIFDAEGNFLTSWGEGVFARPHGITIGPDDAVYCTDDLDHTVRKFTPDGELLLTLGTSGAPSNTGATSIDYRTIARPAGPFHFPTNLSLSPAGEMYVSDGYGNARIHKFAADGRLLLSWGEPGAGPGSVPCATWNRGRPARLGVRSRP